MIRDMAVGVINSINAALAREATRPVRLAPGRPQAQKDFQAHHTIPNKIQSPNSVNPVIRELSRARLEDPKQIKLESAPNIAAKKLAQAHNGEYVLPIRDYQQLANSVFGGKYKYVKALNKELERRTGIKQGTPEAREDAVVKANEDLFQKAFAETKISGFGQLEKLSPEKQINFYNTLGILAGAKANEAASRFDSLMADTKNGPKEFRKGSIDFTIVQLFIKQIRRSIDALNTRAKADEKTQIGRRLAAA